MLKLNLVGRKSIMAALDVKDWKTVLTRIAKGAPIKRRGDGKWAASSDELLYWLEGRDNVGNSKEKGYECVRVNFPCLEYRPDE